MMNVLTHERANQLLRYNPRTGALTWAIDRGGDMYAGTEAGGSDSKTGLLGVCLDRSRNKYKAQIKVGGRTILLGRFGSMRAAHAAYINAKRRFHAGCTL